jgi:hypothetical protein
MNGRSQTGKRASGLPSQDQAEMCVYACTLIIVSARTCACVCVCHTCCAGEPVPGPPSLDFAEGGRADDDDCRRITCKVHAHVCVCVCVCVCLCVRARVCV